MRAIKPKTPTHLPGGSYTSGPTPVADFIEKVWAGIILTIMVPVFVVVVSVVPAYFLIEGVGNFIGLTPAWAELVAHASGPVGAAIPFAGMLLQNVLAGAVVALILAIPVVRRCIRDHRLRELTGSVGTSTVASAFELSLGALTLYALLGALIGVIISVLGLILPVPGGYETALAPGSFLFHELAGGGTGGWPPPTDQISLMAVWALAVLLLAGALFGATLWSLFWLLAKTAIPAAATEAAGGGASALGASLALAATRGHDASVAYDNLSEVVWRGIGHGALTGAVLALILLAGAAVLGIG